MTGWGRFGPNTSALSHEYALEQALDAAQVVVALLPLSFVQKFNVQLVKWNDPYAKLVRRLVGVFELPANAFREEGAEVRTAIAVFGRYRSRAVVREKITSLDSVLPQLELNLDDRAYGDTRLNH